MSSKPPQAAQAAKVSDSSAVSDSVSSGVSGVPGISGARVTGDDVDAATPAPARPRAKGERLEIELEVARQHSISWLLAGGVIGGLLIWKLGTLGAWGGVVLVAIAAYHAWKLVESLRHPPGLIIISDREVVLPRGPCKPRPVTVPRGDVTAVYILRRSVPWSLLAPVLVVELGATAMVFPRDWFASEADQRQVLHALRDTT
jgi:hypothetical protein